MRYNFTLTTKWIVTKLVQIFPWRINLGKTVEINLREHKKQGPVAMVFNLIPGTNLTTI